MFILCDDDLQYAEQRALHASVCATRDAAETQLAQARHTIAALADDARRNNAAKQYEHY